MIRRHFFKNCFRALPAFLMLFCFFNTPRISFASEYDDGHSEFSCNPADSCGPSLAKDIHVIDRGRLWIKDSFTCKSWQKCDAQPRTYMQCICDIGCLEIPAEPKYYDDPINKHIQAQGSDAKNITLPAVLAWKDIAGWKNLGEGKDIRINDQRCIRDTGFNDKGPKSYLIEIQDDFRGNSKDKGIDNLNIGKGDTTAIGGKTAFTYVITETYSDGSNKGFNSRDDGGTCFFNTNSAYRWRVRPCCDAYGQTCKKYGTEENWWYFTTGPAPEPLGITDKNHSGASPAQDPDWNGTDYLKNVDFCTAKLSWCKTKLVDDPKNRFWKSYNDYQMDFAANYQMRVKFSENWSLNLVPSFTNLSATAPTWQSFLMNGLYNNPIAQSFSQIVSQAVKGMDYTNKESCHYLEKQQDGTCKPETVSFAASEIQQADFKPFFDAEKRKNQNRGLFTGDMNGNLKYSWELKPCFNTAPNNDDKNFPFCNGYNDENYGQKWKFAGAAVNIAGIKAPDLLSPEDNPAYDENKLAGLGSSLQWSAPCGANSFVYDIKKVNANGQGKSIFAPDGSYGKDKGRRTTVSQIFISLTNKSDPAQGSDHQKIILELDKSYQWQVRSCWPSVPWGDDISLLCSNKWSLPGSHFRTTGRKPKAESMKTATSAPKVTFNWENVPGAGSYRLKIVGKNAPAEQVLTSSQFTFEYSEPLQSYSWMVKTCADSAGQICGNDWGMAPQQYTSENFAAPMITNPNAKTIQSLPPQFSWNGGGNYFKIKLEYSPAGSGKLSAHCDPKEINFEKIIRGNYYANGSSYNTCPGNYTLNVQACFNGSCSGTNGAIATSAFAINDVNQKDAGFMVCGQRTDNPKTQEYDEMEPCQIKHLVLTIKIIIDFITFKLMFIIIPILLLATAFFFYNSGGDPKMIGIMKESWKTIGKGYLFLIFAWLLVSLLMQVAGYNAIWWKIL